MKNWFVRYHQWIIFGAFVVFIFSGFTAAMVLPQTSEERRANITEPQYRLYCNAGAYNSNNIGSVIEGSSRGAIVEDLKSWYVLGDGFKVFYMSGVSEWFASGNPCSIVELR